MDETYIKVKGEWINLYLAKDKEDNTNDFLLTRKRNKYAAYNGGNQTKYRYRADHPEILIRAIYSVVILHNT
jgi:hypothetical protein